MGERQPHPHYPQDSLPPIGARVATLDPGLGAIALPRQEQRPEAAARDDTARGVMFGVWGGV